MVLIFYLKKSKFNANSEIHIELTAEQYWLKREDKKYHMFGTQKNNG